MSENPGTGGESHGAGVPDFAAETHDAGVPDFASETHGAGEPDGTIAGWLRRAWGTRRGTGGLKFEAAIYLGTAAFFAVVLALYWFTSYEDGGAVMLLFTVCLGLLPGSYMLFWSRRMRKRPEDRLDAEVDDGIGPVGSFPDQSVWPFVLGTGMGFCALGLVFGPWLGLIGGIMAFSAVAGVTVESRRGGSV